MLTPDSVSEIRAILDEWDQIPAAEAKIRAILDRKSVMTAEDCNCYRCSGEWQPMCRLCEQYGRVPNAETIASIEASERGEVIRYESAEAMFKALGIE